MIEYTIALIASYVAAKWISPRCPSIKTQKYHLHHWMWASILLLIALWHGWTPDWLVGGVAGIALQGLSYKNWGIYTATT